MTFQQSGILFLHIPDGFLSVPVAVVGWLLATLTVGLAIRQTRENLDDRRIPVIGVMAAFIFAAQSINFPVAGGTSGHLIGGALLAILLGPWTAVLVMTAVIVLQALLFQDGGILVMGWNIINMAILTTLSSAILFSLVRRFIRDPRLALVIGGAVAAWLSVELAATATALQLAASGTVPLKLALLALTSVHALIGLGEAIITVAALLLIWRVRPDLFLMNRPNYGQSFAGRIKVGLALFFSMAFVLLSYVASDLPDGLERVAEDLGFMRLLSEPAFEVMPGYALPFLENPYITGILALLVGALLVIGLVLLLGRFVRSSSPTH